MLNRRAFSQLVIAGLPLTLAADDWPQWRGPNRDGAAPPDAAPGAWPEKLKQLWKIPVGEGHSSPVVLHDRIVQFTRLGDRERVASFEFASGRKLWEQSYPAPYEMNPAATAHGKGPKSTPLLADGKVYTLGMSGVLLCLDAATGNQIWKYDSAANWRQVSPAFGVAMSPVLYKGTLIAHVGTDKNGAMTAFDAQTGSVRWQWKGEGPAYSSPILVATGGATQLITFSAEKFISLNPADGSLVWQIPFTTPYTQNAVTPFVFEDLVIYSGLSNPITAVRVSGKSPQKVWENRELGMYMSSPVLAAGLLHGLSHRNKGQYFSLDPRTGKTVWTSEGRQTENAMLISRGATVFACTTDSELLVMKASPQGLQIGRKYTVATSPVWAHPVVLGPRVLVKDKDSLMLWTA